MTPQGEPRTQAGRDLVHRITWGIKDRWMNEMVARIEAEAAAPVEGLREALEALLSAAENVDGCWHDGGTRIEYHGDLPEALIALRRAFEPYDLALAATPQPTDAAALRAIESQNICLHDGIEDASDCPHAPNLQETPT